MVDKLPPPPFTSEITEDKRDKSKTMVVTNVWKQWFVALADYVSDNPSGFSGTIPLAKLTAGGTNGTITVVDGLITACTPPT